MADDPMDRFRHAGLRRPVSHVPGGPSAAGHYEAYRVAGKPPRRLAIRPAMRTWERAGYNFLLRVTEDGVYGSSMALVFTFMAVLIRGRNLKPIIEAIDAETCEFVQQFDADRWLPPVDAKAPYIESIVIEAENRFNFQKTRG
jgi:hypothetical protein